MTARMLPDRRRLHLSDGPIDLLIRGWGRPAEIAAAYAAAQARLAGMLDELCAELGLLRAPADAGMQAAISPVAQRMQCAVQPYAAGFITPMAAVAGAVAEAVLAAMTGAAVLERAYVNDGGDIALHLAAGQSLCVGLIDRPDRPSLFATAVIRAEDGIAGIATSGWRGRSHSLGIADAVTVLAGGAADADAAATVIANAVDLPGHPGIARVPASTLDPDSDLGRRLVTRGVAPLREAEKQAALAAGGAVARALVAAGAIRAAALHVQGVTRIEAAQTQAAPCRAA